MNSSQYIELGGLFVTVFSTLIIPFLERPFLGYSDIEIPQEYASSNDKKFLINVTNHGFETANGLVLSINSSVYKVNFTNFILNPSVPNHLISNSSNTQVGHGVLEITNIPARQNFGVEGYIYSPNPNITSDDLIPSLFSNETTGYSNGVVMITVNLILVFIIVAIVAIIYLIIEDRFPTIIFKLKNRHQNVD